MIGPNCNTSALSMKTSSDCYGLCLDVGRRLINLGTPLADSLPQENGWIFLRKMAGIALFMNT
eukprot:1147635-Pelagomonas_calceolata.AAC.2